MTLKIEVVYCDNCGARYYTKDGDSIFKTMHGVCSTCFLPMEIQNPFYKDGEIDDKKHFR